jgi:hypothetical protein
MVRKYLNSSTCDMIYCLTTRGKTDGVNKYENRYDIKIVSVLIGQ